MSDIHFGVTDRAVIDGLVSAARLIRPDLVVISGDLTQRARKSEFELAADFIRSISSLGLNVLAMPGNHDIPPLYSPIKRMSGPYDRFNTLIAPLILKEYSNTQIAVRGINTVRATRIKGGGISKRAIAEAVSWFTAQDNSAVRIVVTHHPLDLPEDQKKHKLVRKAKSAIYQLARSHIDVFLSGHYHRSSVIRTSERYTSEHRTAIAVQAGTVSKRQRGELQSFNVLQIENGTIFNTSHIWEISKASFVTHETARFEFRDGHWISA